MTDIFTKKKRSEIMSRIRSKDTKPELALARLLRRNGIRYRRNLRIPGTKIRADFILTGRKICLFVDGCFWHACPKCFKEPKSNITYWRDKIAGNKKRDSAQSKTLKKAGWTVVRIWEHELSGSGKHIQQKDLICKLKF